MPILKEFKEFAMRGNVMDMAVGVVIGGAFGTIVSSLVADIIMPPVGMLIGGVHFSELAITLRPEKIVNDMVEQTAVTLNYGTFFQTILDFIIIAFAIFFLIRGINLLRKKKEAAAPPAPSKEEILLTEIRDILKEKK